MIKTQRWMQWLEDWYTDKRHLTKVGSFLEEVTSKSRLKVWVGVSLVNVGVKAEDVPNKRNSMMTYKHVCVRKNMVSLKYSK